MSDADDSRRWLVYLAVLVVAMMLINVCVKIFYRGNPEIVVYLDKDAKKPEILPLPTSKVIVGDRAILWWSVFNKCLDRNEGIYDAKRAASDAVITVYGSL
jgi:hypothetical protein